MGAEYTKLEKVLSDRGWPNANVSELAPVLLSDYFDLCSKVTDLEEAVFVKGGKFGKYVANPDKKKTKYTQTRQETGTQTDETNDTMELEQGPKKRLVDCIKLKKLVRYEKVYRRKIEKMQIEHSVSASPIKFKKVKCENTHTKTMKVYTQKTIKEETKHDIMEIEFNKPTTKDSKTNLRKREPDDDLEAVKLCSLVLAKKPKLNKNPNTSLKIAIPTKPIKFKIYPKSITPILPQAQTHIGEFFQTLPKTPLLTGKGPPPLEQIKERGPNLFYDTFSSYE